METVVTLGVENKREKNRKIIVFNNLKISFSFEQKEEILKAINELGGYRINTQLFIQFQKLNEKYTIYILKKGKTFLFEIDNDKLETLKKMIDYEPVLVGKPSRKLELNDIAILAKTEQYLANIENVHMIDGEIGNSIFVANVKETEKTVITFLQDEKISGKACLDAIQNQIWYEIELLS